MTTVTPARPQSVPPPRALPARTGRALGDRTRLTLELLAVDPQSVHAVAQALNAPYTTAWSLIKHLVEQGRAERVAPGQYLATPAGRSALYPPAYTQEPAVKPARVVAPPTGWRWTPERKTWLARYYPLLGHRRCSRLLGREPAAVHAMATRLGLRHGADVEGYTLLTQVAEILGRSYSGLWTRAQRAGVLTFPVQAQHSARRRKALVPDWWVDRLMQDLCPPAPGEMALSALRAELGISKTHAQRLATGDGVLRDPGQDAGQQAVTYVSSAVAQRIRQAWSNRPNYPQRGRPVVHAALQRAGANGMTPPALVAATGMTRAALQHHLNGMERDSTLIREGRRYVLTMFTSASEEGRS